MAIFFFMKITGVGEDVEKLGTLCTAGGNVKWGSRCGKVWWFLKKLNRTTITGSYCPAGTKFMPAMISLGSHDGDGYNTVTAFKFHSAVHLQMVKILSIILWIFYPTQSNPALAIKRLLRVWR